MTLESKGRGPLSLFLHQRSARRIASAVEVVERLPPDLGRPQRRRRHVPVPAWPMKKGKLKTLMSYRTSTPVLVRLYSGTPGSETLTGTGAEVEAYDWLLLPGEVLAQDTNVVVALLDGYWYVIAASCPL